jgi:hypothetical protein
MWWDVKRSLSMPIFLVHNIFIMLAGYEGVRLSSVAVEVTLEKGAYDHQKRSNYRV